MKRLTTRSDQGRVAQDPAARSSVFPKIFCLVLGVGCGLVLLCRGVGSLLAGSNTLMYRDGYGQVFYTTTYTGFEALPYSLAESAIGWGFIVVGVFLPLKLGSCPGRRQSAVWQDRLLLAAAIAILSGAVIVLLPCWRHELFGA